MGGILYSIPTMNVENTIEAIVRYQNRRLFVVTQSGQLWAITDEDKNQFSLVDGLTVVIAQPEMIDQFCQVRYVVPQSEVFNRQFEEWQGDSKDNSID